MENEQNALEEEVEEQRLVDLVRKVPGEERIDENDITEYGLTVMPMIQGLSMFLIKTSLTE